MDNSTLSQQPFILYYFQGSASNIVYLEKGESGCISFSQAETNTDRAIKRENSVLCMQFSGSKEVGFTFPAAWSRSFSCQTNDSHISVCISSATEEDGGIFFYTFGLLTIDNRTLMIESKSAELNANNFVRRWQHNLSNIYMFQISFKVQNLQFVPRLLPQLEKEKPQS